VARAANNGREDSTRGIVSGKTGFAHTGPVVNNKSLNVVARHNVEKKRVLER